MLKFLSLGLSCAAVAAASPLDTTASVAPALIKATADTRATPEKAIKTIFRFAKDLALKQLAKEVPAPVSTRRELQSSGGCTNTCGFASDSYCDDGGPGYIYSACTCGTDCVDCGTRSASDCANVTSGSSSAPSGSSGTSNIIGVFCTQYEANPSIISQLASQPGVDAATASLLQSILPCICSPGFISLLSTPLFSTLSSSSATAADSNAALAALIPAFCGSAECRNYLSVSITAGLAQSAPAAGAATLTLSATDASTMTTCICERPSMFTDIATASIAQQQSTIENNIVAFCSSTSCRSMIVTLNPNEVSATSVNSVCTNIPSPTGGNQVTFSASVTGTFSETAYKNRLATYTGVAQSAISISTSTTSGRRLNTAVTATITTASPSAAITTQQQLSSISTTNSQAVLGVTVASNPTTTDQTNAGSVGAPPSTSFIDPNAAAANAIAGGSGDDPCFDAETTLSCRLAPGAAITAAEAYAECYEHQGGTQATLTPMLALRAGDVVVAYTDGALSLDYVVVNQHTDAIVTSPMMRIDHTSGSLRLTPDHVLMVDGKFSAARETLIGSTLTLADGQQTVVGAVGAIPRARAVNPMTSRGTILAMADGKPVVAATHPEWIAALLLATPGPLALPCLHLLANLAPKQLQAYYDAVIEPAYKHFLAPHTKPLSEAPSAALFCLCLLADAVSAVGFLVFTLGASVPLALLVGAIGMLALRTQKRKA